MIDMEFENRLRSIATGMDYPQTPGLSAIVITRLRGRSGGHPRFISRKLAWSLTIILILFSSLMLIPPARAALLEFIQIGIVRIFPPPTAPLAKPSPTAEPVSPVPPTSTPSTSSLIPALAQMAGRITLAEAQAKVDYPILLPKYPPDLGAPEFVFVQNMDGNMVILVWLDPQTPEKILMSLHIIPNGSWAIKKFEPTVIDETTVNGERAVWTSGPYPIILTNGEIQFERLITGHVLIWADPDVTYRLETDLSMDEAVRIAESLEPPQ